MQKSVKLLTFVFAGAALLQSCASDPIEIPRDELYAREFIKEFGVVQPGNPFNVATRCGVRVVTAKATDVKISAKIGGREYLFADYKGIDGTSDIYFDLPGSVKDIFVRANGKKIPAKVGDTVDLRGNVSRTAHYSNEGDYIKVEKTEESEWMTIPSDDALIYRSVLPEKNTNLGKVTQRFYYISTGEPFIIYPVYWQTSTTHQFGIYWHENGEMKKQPIYTMKSDAGDASILMVCKPNSVWKNDISNTEGWVVAALGENFDFDKINPKKEVYDADIAKIFEQAICKEMGWVGVIYDPIYGSNTSLTISGYSGPDNNWKACTADEPITASFDGFVRSKGIKVTIPAGVRFGFYSDTGGKSAYGNAENIFYSESMYNPDWYYDGEFDKDLDKKLNSKKHEPETRACHMATFVEPKYGWTYLGVEDWSETYGGSDMDLNDFIIRLVNAPAVHDKDEEEKNPEPEPGDDDLPTYEWIIAAEDLGNTYDFDFNDMVVGINYVAGTKEIKVRPLAAGGIYPVYLMFDKPDGTTMMVNKELHNWFGRSTNQVTNAHENGEEFTADEFTIIWTGEGDFSLAGYAHDSKWGGPEDAPITNMGGFWLLVDKDGKYSSASDFSNAKNEDGGQAVVPNLTKGDVYAPQMICVGTDWCWPREGSHIHEKAYSGFADWIAKPGEVLDTWYGANLADGYTHNTNHTVKRKSVENYQKPITTE